MPNAKMKKQVAKLTRQPGCLCETRGFPSLPRDRFGTCRLTSPLKGCDASTITIFILVKSQQLPYQLHMGKIHKSFQMVMVFILHPSDHLDEYCHYCFPILSVRKNLSVLTRHPFISRLFPSAVNLAATITLPAVVGGGRMPDAGNPFHGLICDWDRAS